MASITPAVIDTLIAEAGGEGDPGLIAAAWAIQQRAAARGQTIDQVVRSGFDGFSDPGSGARRAQQDPAMRARVERIMGGVANGSIPNPVPGADHFLSGDVMPGWANKMKLVATIGGHRFYASGNVPQAAYGPLIPPGELPEVASLTDTVPPRPGVPVTASPNLQALRNAPRVSLSRNATKPGADLALTDLTTVTPRLTDDGGDVMSYWIPEATQTTVQRGFGSLTPNARQTTPANAPLRGIPGSSAGFAGQEKAPDLRAPQLKVPGSSGFVGQDRGPATRPTPGQSGMAGQDRGPTTRVTPGQSGFAAQDGARAASTPRPAPLTQRPRPQSFAGQEANPVPGRLPRIGPNGGGSLSSSAPTPARQSLEMEIMRALGEPVTTVPTTSNAPRPATQSPQMAGRRAQDQGLAADLERWVRSPTPAVQSADMAVRRSPGTTVATIPTTGVGQPPSTRVVKSVPMTTPKPAATVPANLPTSGLSRDAVAQRARAQRELATTRTAIPGPNNPMVKDQARLGSGFAIPDMSHTAPIVTARAQVVVAPQQQPQTALSMRPIPLPRSARPTDVGTLLDTEPMGGGGEGVVNGTLRTGPDGLTYEYKQAANGGQWQQFQIKQPAPTRVQRPTFGAMMPRQPVQIGGMRMGANARPSNVAERITGAGTLASYGGSSGGSIASDYGSSPYWDAELGRMVTPGK